MTFDEEVKVRNGVLYNLAWHRKHGVIADAECGIRPEELRTASKIYLINAITGLEDGIVLRL